VPLRIVATTNVQSHVKRLGQQRLQLRDVQHNRLPASPVRVGLLAFLPDRDALVAERDSGRIS
jgi:hypothetical protein